LHGDLKVRGGNAGSAIVLDQVGLNPGQVRITASGDTTVNGGAGPVILSGLTRGLSVSLAEGADNITLDNLSLPGNAVVSARGDSSIITFDNVQVAKNVNIHNNGNLSTIDLIDTTVGRNLILGHGQNIALESVTVDRNSAITGGRLSDTVTVDNSIFHGAMGLHTSHGADLIQLGDNGDPQGVPNAFDGPVRITLGGGADILQLGGDSGTADHSTFSGKVFFDGDGGGNTLRNFEPSSYIGNSRFRIKNFQSIVTNPTTTPPTVSSTNPASHATNVALNLKIAATFSEPIDPTTITAQDVTVTAPGSVPVAGTLNYAGTTVTFTPQAPLAADTVYTMTIATGVEDLAKTPLATAYTTTFTTGAAADTTPPAVSSTDPANSQTGVALNNKIAATFSEAMDPLTLTTADVSVTGPGSVSVLGTVSDVGATMTFSPTSDLAPDTLYTATITAAAKDLAGNALASNYVWTFTTGATPDTTAPTVVATDPANNATGVALNKELAVTFSEAMDPLTLTAADVSVTGPGSVSVLGTVNDVGATMTFTPTSNLAPDTLYTATITTAAKDLAGNALAANDVWTFTTGATPDTTLPTVSSTNPVAAQTNFPLNNAVAATFSEPMDPQTINAATMTLDGPGSTPITGTVTYDSTNDIASFTPSSNLAPNTTFTATISGGANGVKDLAGNPLASDDVWTFTTGTQIAQAPINLGAAGAFAVMATASISGTGPTVINGNVGLNPGTSQGIPPAQVNGTIDIDNQAIMTAQADLLSAYNDAVNRSVTPVTLPGNMGGLTFTPGLYTNSSSVLIEGAGANNNVTLDAQGNPNAVFIFQMGSTLTTGTGAQVILTGGAKASNIFWQVGTSATLGTGTMFQGNILAATTITVNNGSIVDGRLLGGSTTAGSVTVNASTVTVPSA
jgi:methionine-rich copper-binding protein CopC